MDHKIGTVTNPRTTAIQEDRLEGPVMTDLSILPSSDGFRNVSTLTIADDTEKATVCPPSFAQSEFETILKRQQTKHPHGVKITADPSRYASLDSQWEFASYGTMSYLGLSQGELAAAEEKMTQKPPMVGQLRGTGLPGNSMTSSVFYAFPAVVAASAIFSPIALLVACLILFLWKPVFLELGTAIRLNGGTYAYLLQVSGKNLGLIAAAATLLDSVATSAVSAATAASYLRGESETLPISESVITIVLLVGLAAICFLNVRRSSALTLSFFAFHMFTMALLMILSVVYWARHGSDVLESNWDLRPRGASNVATAIFNGVCIGFLGVTGFETTPTYIEAIRPDVYPSVLRNILICTLALNAPLLLLVYAVLPSVAISGGANILSILAQTVAGRWLRVLVVIDCVLVLAGGVIDGICSACATLDRLAKDHVLSQMLLRLIPATGAPYLSIIVCLIINILLYASSGLNLATISAVFTVAFLFILLMFVLSDLLLNYNRGRIPRSYRAGLPTVFLTFALALVLLIGNIMQDPKILGLFAVYFFVIYFPFIAMRARVSVAKVLMWFYYQTELHNHRWTAGWEAKLVGVIKRARRHPICVWVRREDVHNLMEIVLYVRNNETTGNIVFMHAYRRAEDIPRELAANVSMVDEAFPAITIDLIFVQGIFEPALVEAVSTKRGIPRSQMFMSCPGENHGRKVAEYQGVRVVDF